MRRAGAAQRMVLIVVAGLVSTAAWASCPFCPNLGPTLSEQLAQTDATVLAKWLKVIEPASEEDDPQTVFEVVEVLRAPKDLIEKGREIRIKTLRQAEPGDLFLVFAQRSEAGTTDWHTPTDATEISYQYLKQAPSLEGTSTTERLAYFLKFLEVSDPLIAGDAFAEFSRAKYEDVVPLAPKFSRKKLREWVATTDPQRAIRRGFYGMVLGLCGDDDDAQFLAERILPPPKPNEHRIGVDGLMAGYVLLTSDEGLRRLSTAKLDAADVPDGEVYAVLGALRFLWEFAGDRVPREAVARTMRRLLERPTTAESVIVDLARWKDWGSLDVLSQRYGQPPFDIDSAKEKAAVFALVCRKEALKTKDESLAAKAQALIDRVQAESPDLLRAAEQQLRGPRPIKRDAAPAPKD